MSKAEEAQKELYRRLAHNDKHIRDRGVKMLKNFLSKRRQLNEVGMMKIWKAVFYCFWMSDKTPIQMELAERLAGLLHEQNEEQALLYLKCFWLTIGREWNNVDRLRLDKFMSLVRFFVRHTFVMLHRKQWNSELLEATMQVMQLVAINSTAAEYRGLVMHVCDLYVDELIAAPQNAASNEKQIPSEAFRACLVPYYILICKFHDPSLVNRVEQKVLVHLLEKHAEEDEENTSDPAVNLFDEVAYAATLMFDIGADPETRSKARTLLYALHQKFKMYLSEVDAEFELPSNQNDEDESDDEVAAPVVEQVVQKKRKNSESAKPEVAVAKTSKTAENQSAPAAKVASKPVETKAESKTETKTESKAESKSTKSDTPAKSAKAAATPAKVVEAVAQTVNTAEPAVQTPKTSIKSDNKTDEKKKGKSPKLSVVAFEEPEPELIVTPTNSTPAHMKGTPMAVTAPTPMHRKPVDDEIKTPRAPSQSSSQPTSGNRVQFHLHSNKIKEFDKTKAIGVAEDVEVMLAKKSRGSALKSTPTLTPKASNKTSKSPKTPKTQLQLNTQQNSAERPVVMKSAGKLKTHAADFF